MESAEFVFNRPPANSTTAKFAVDQPQYVPLVMTIVKTKGTPAVTRWTLTDEERQMIAEGGTVCLQVLTFGGNPAPVNLQIVPQDQDPVLCTL